MNLRGDLFSYVALKRHCGMITSPRYQHVAKTQHDNHDDFSSKNNFTRFLALEKVNQGSRSNPWHIWCFLRLGRHQRRVYHPMASSQCDTMRTQQVSFALSCGSISKIAFGLCLGLLWTVVIIAVVQVAAVIVLPWSPSVHAENTTSLSAETENLRYTTLGWQDPANWMARPQQGSRLNLGSVSPLIWAAMLVLAVGIAVMWFSNDDEVERIFHDRLEKAELIAQWKSQQRSIEQNQNQ